MLYCEQYLCMRVLWFDFSLPRIAMMATSKKSVPAARTNIAMRMFHVPQCPGCPNHQQPSSFCNRAQCEFLLVKYTEATRLRAHNASNIYQIAASQDAAGLEGNPRDTEQSGAQHQAFHDGMCTNMVIACVVATADHRGHTAVSRDLMRVKLLDASSAISAWIADRQKGSMMLVLGSAGCSPGTAPAENFWMMKKMKTA